MEWNIITEVAQLDEIDRESDLQSIMIFKHSNRCGTSSTAMSRVERGWLAENNKLLKPYFLDLLSFRHISNAIEERYGVRHESPQVLIISKGKCIFSQTHLNIHVPELLQVATG